MKFIFFLFLDRKVKFPNYQRVESVRRDIEIHQGLFVYNFFLFYLRLLFFDFNFLGRCKEHDFRQRQRVHQSKE